MVINYKLKINCGNRDYTSIRTFNLKSLNDDNLLQWAPLNFKNTVSEFKDWLTDFDVERDVFELCINDYKFRLIDDNTYSIIDCSTKAETTKIYKFNDNVDSFLMEDDKEVNEEKMDMCCNNDYNDIDTSSDKEPSIIDTKCISVIDKALSAFQTFDTHNVFDIFSDIEKCLTDYSYELTSVNNNDAIAIHLPYSIDERMCDYVCDLFDSRADSKMFLSYLSGDTYKIKDTTTFFITKTEF